MVAAAIALLSAPGYANDHRDRGEAGLVGGREIDPCAWPAAVRLGQLCSGVLIHPRVVAYAAHCGTRFNEVTAVAQGRAATYGIARCATHEDAAVGNGADIAFCVLAEPVVGVPLVRPLEGCERELAVKGAAVTMVGFGKRPDGGLFGTKQSADALIAELGDEIEVGAPGVGTCEGDSGGPAFLRLGGSEPWRILGVFSSRKGEDCTPGAAWLTDVGRWLRWLEDASGVDVSPCYDERGAWQPTPRCRVGPSAPERSDSCTTDPVEEYATVCGAPFEPGSGDDQAPIVRILAPSPSVRMSKVRSIDVVVEASDRGWGVEHVQLGIACDAGTVFDAVDEVPPYRFSNVPIGDERCTIKAVASDFAGQSSEATIVIDPVVEKAPSSDGGCAVGSPRRSRGARLDCLVLGVVSAIFVRTRLRRIAPRFSIPMR